MNKKKLSPEITDTQFQLSTKCFLQPFYEIYSNFLPFTLFHPFELKMHGKKYRVKFFAIIKMENLKESAVEIFVPEIQFQVKGFSSYLFHSCMTTIPNFLIHLWDFILFSSIFISFGSDWTIKYFRYFHTNWISSPNSLLYQYFGVARFTFLFIENMIVFWWHHSWKIPISIKPTLKFLWQLTKHDDIIKRDSIKIDSKCIQVNCKNRTKVFYLILIQVFHSWIIESEKWKYEKFWGKPRKI